MFCTFVFIVDKKAREKMANIYLNFRKDKKMFAQCYR